MYGVYSVYSAKYLRYWVSNLHYRYTKDAFTSVLFWIIVASIEFEFGFDGRLFGFNTVIFIISNLIFWHNVWEKVKVTDLSKKSPTPHNLQSSASNESANWRWLPDKMASSDAQQKWIEKKNYNNFSSCTYLVNFSRCHKSISWKCSQGSFKRQWVEYFQQIFPWSKQTGNYPQMSPSVFIHFCLEGNYNWF